MNAPKPKRILFFMLTLGGGGAEQVALTLMKYLDPKRYRSLLVVLSLDKQKAPHLPFDIRVINLKKRGRLDFIRLLSSFRKAVFEFKPDIVLSFTYYVNIIAVLSLLRVKCPPKVILSEHNYFPIYLKRMRFGSLKYWLMRWTYRRADCVIAITQKIMDELKCSFKLEDSKLKLIYNPVPIKAIDHLKREALPQSSFQKKIKSRVIAVGRLSAQKRFDRLLEAFADMSMELDAELLILGQGSLLFDLEQKANALGIRSKIYFVGYQTNPYSWIASSDVLVLSSDFEGFPMVLLESMACGTAVVAVNCQTGPDELINSGESGMLVQELNAKDLSKALQNVLQQDDLRSHLEEGGKKRVQDFDISIILPLYEACFK